MELETTETEQDTTNTGDTSTEIEGNGTFTQDQVNKIVIKRVKEVKAQFKDYKSLQDTVTTLTAQVEALTAEKDTVKKQYLDTAFSSLLDSTAMNLNLDPELALKLLDKDKLIFVEDKPTNLKELLHAVIEKHPSLVKKVVITPVIPSVTLTEGEKNFSLHKTSKSNFFSGGGLKAATLISK